MTAHMLSLLTAAHEPALRAAAPVPTPEKEAAQGERDERDRRDGLTLRGRERS